MHQVCGEEGVDPPPIQFRGRSFRSAKGFLEGTHRARSPLETIQLIEPYLPVAGVTRIADITGLDRVGLPTTLALRPNAPTMACSSGKGVTPEQAFVSGAMEAIELHAAESVSLSQLRGTYRDLSKSFVMPAADHLPLTRDSLFSIDWPFYWCAGWDIVGQCEMLVPMAMVGMARASMIGSLRSFQVSSNGLGAGNTFLEAVTAALYEVIERDGVACNFQAALHHSRPIPVLGEEVVRSYDLVAGVIAKCDRAKIGVLVQDCTIDPAVSIFHAYVYDTVDHGVPVTKGSGAHLDPEIAILRAITEALQGRLNFIAGSRDDLFRQAFVRARAGWQDSVRALQEIREHCPLVGRRHEPRTTETFEGDIRLLIATIVRSGFENVIVFDLTPKDFEIFLVRVIVPGYEGYMHHGYHPGQRAMRFHETSASQ